MLRLDNYKLSLDGEWLLSPFFPTEEPYHLEFKRDLSTKNTIQKQLFFTMFWAS